MIAPPAPDFMDFRDLAAVNDVLVGMLRPPAPPAVPGMGAAAYHRPVAPEGVGGDFYDMFDLGDGVWALFLGDVCGKGAKAAALSVLCRSALRLAFTRDADPAAALRSLNGVLLQEPEDRAPLCTAVCATVRPGPSGAEVVLASAGHPPPLVIRPNAGRPGIRPLDGPTGLLLGAFAEPSIETVRMRLHAGQTLLLHTDGFTDIRLPDGSFLGDERLVPALAALSPVGARGAVEAARTLLSLPSHTPTDDIALLALSADR